MHPNLEELLALRDGDGADEVARHVQGCALCASEIDELRDVASALGALPPVGARTDLWPAIRNRIVQRRRRRVGFRFAVAAAGVAAVISAVVISRSPGTEPARMVREIDRQTAIEELTAASQGLEQLLRDPALHRQVLSGRRAAVIVDLEDRIAFLDMALAHQQGVDGGERSVALWSHRVELLDALVAARAGSGADDGVGYAVFHYEGSQP